MRRTAGSQKVMTRMRKLQRQALAFCRTATLITGPASIVNSVLGKYLGGGYEPLGRGLRPLPLVFRQPAAFRPLMRFSTGLVHRESSEMGNPWVPK